MAGKETGQDRQKTQRRRASKLGGGGCSWIPCSLPLVVALCDVGANDSTCTCSLHLLLLLFLDVAHYCWVPGARSWILGGRSKMAGGGGPQASAFSLILLVGDQGRSSGLQGWWSRAAVLGCS